MKAIIDYLKSLVPVCERSDMLKIVSGLRDEHNDSLMPVLQTIRETLGDKPLTSKLYKDYEIRLRRYVNYGNNQSALGLLLKSLENMQALFPFVEKEIREHFGPQVATASLTYDSVNVLRFLDSMALYIRYGRKFLLKVIADESAALGGTRPELVRGEQEYLDNNLDNFAGLFPAMLKTEGELRAIFRKVSTAMVDEATSDLAYSSLGGEKIDPLRLANFSPQKNWLMGLGRAWVEWQVARHRSAKEDLIALQMRLQELKELQDSGKASPAVQKMIGNLQDRITKMDSKLNKVEEDALEDRSVLV
ncbi:virion structural protein [Pseudomonas phage Noxifer]|uniref:Virion structural protein n=1 Tax=Pseudomonas phage Noxifer TaxID=2006684 RepID=A0A1Y0SUT2_9CAUD|nr:virion structural protein [Pseudomonas phage Noxifer]ARV77261.1 virion structural protein [Pseudomonas phage Noxifer]